MAVLLELDMLEWLEKSYFRKKRVTNIVLRKQSVDAMLNKV